KGTAGEAHSGGRAWTPAARAIRSGPPSSEESAATSFFLQDRPVRGRASAEYLHKYRRFKGTDTEATANAMKPPSVRVSDAELRMARPLTAPLEPFVDALPVASRLIAAEHHGRLTIYLRAGEHRFHRDLPESRIWGYDGKVPGPTIEAERGQAVIVEWRNELEGPFPVVVTVAPESSDADGVPVQSVPGLSGGTP